MGDAASTPRALFWAALPARLPSGARVFPSPTERGGYVEIDGENLLVDVVLCRGMFRLEGAFGVLRRVKPSEASARAARELLAVVAARKKATASAIARDEQIAEARRLTEASGTVELPHARGSMPYASVTPFLDAPGFQLAMQVPMGTWDIEAIFALLRERGVLPALVPPPRDLFNLPASRDPTPTELAAVQRAVGAIVAHGALTAEEVPGG